MKGIAQIEGVQVQRIHSSQDLFLRIEGKDVDVAFLKQINELHRVKILSLHNATLSIEAWEFLANSAELTDLSVLHLNARRGSRLLSVDFLDHCNLQPSLESIAVSGLQIDQSVIESIGMLPAIKSLNISFAELGGSFAVLSSRQTPLKSLTITATQITSEDVRAISDLPKLRELTLDDVRLNREQLMTLVDSSSLNGLYLGGASIIDEAMQEISRRKPQITVRRM